MIWSGVKQSIPPFKGFGGYLYGVPETVFDKLNNSYGTLPNLRKATEIQVALSFLENRLDVKQSKAKKVSAVCLDLDSK